MPRVPVSDEPDRSAAYRLPIAAGGRRIPLKKFLGLTSHGNSPTTTIKGTAISCFALETPTDNERERDRETQFAFLRAAARKKYRSLSRRARCESPDASAKRLSDAATDSRPSANSS